MHKQLRYLTFIYTISFLLVFTLVIIRLLMKKDIDILKREDLISGCDWWCVSHFMLYVLLGYFAPKFWYVSFTLSFIWEYIESILEKYNIYINSKGLSDIKTNTIGLLLGIILHEIFIP